MVRPETCSLWGRDRRGYVAAALGAAATSALLSGLDQPIGLLLLFPAQQLLALGCALRWGLGPGLLGLLLGAALGQIALLRPGGALVEEAAWRLAGLCVFLVAGGLATGLAADRRRRGEALSAVQIELALVQAELAACESELERRGATDERPQAAL